MTRTARGTAADDGGPLRRTARLPAHRRRAGASLVMVLAAVATVVSLALGAAALSRNLRLRTDARAGRAALRDQAESALAELMVRKVTFSEIKSTVKTAVSKYIYRKTQRSPMIIPVIMNAE